MPAMDYAKVARVYDAYANTQVDVSFFVEEAKGCENVLELTSGTGRLSIPLIEAGVRLSCLDSSREMLAVLREKLAAKGLEAPVYEMDMCSFSLDERFDLIFIPFNSFAEIVEREDQIRALKAIRKHLGDGGRFICTFHNPAVRLKLVDGKMHERGKFRLPGGNILVLSSIERFDPTAQLVEGEQGYQIQREDGEVLDQWKLGIQFNLHSREDIERLASGTGYRVEALFGDYGRSQFDPENSLFMIWVLGKIALPD